MELVLTGMWAQALATFPELKQKIPEAINKAVLQEAQELRKRIVSQFREQRPVSGSWAPLSPLTLRARRVQGFKGSKILIRSADMRNSVQVQVVGPGRVFVGVHRSALSRGVGTEKPRALFNIGKIHEFGAVVKVVVTRKMQRFLFGVLLKTAKGRGVDGRFLKGGAASAPKGSGRFKLGATLTIRIPARPFIGPAVSALSQSQYEASVGARIAVLLRGKLGKP